VAVLRSKKYLRLSDTEILKLYSDRPKGEALHFLSIEIEQRNLSEQAETLLKESRTRSRHSLLYYLFYAVMFAFFAARFGQDLL